VTAMGTKNAECGIWESNAPCPMGTDHAVGGGGGWEKEGRNEREDAGVSQGGGGVGQGGSYFQRFVPNPVLGINVAGTPARRAWENLTPSSKCGGYVCGSTWVLPTGAAGCGGVGVLGWAGVCMGGW